ncbi:NAD(P)/FAD-dependent oxidoreductase [Pseudonocardia xishanensis]|uniref:NAD(P)/FAD-dependent oxidoreductase n=1 Tax=Pseudonocardia xishanensis TaxID=630995 RepID=A0ABP8RTJ6_9PSEU
MTTHPNDATPAEADVVVVGAGFAGLYLVHRLRSAGLDVVGIEAGSDVGGTWYWNRYPGARCDIPSMLYSYSFDEDLVKEWDWPEKYSAQPDILAYLNHVADRFDLRRSFRFDTRVRRADFDDHTGRWIVATEGGGVLSARHLVTAVGALSKSKPPEVPGLERFAGRWMHTGAWPQEDVDLAGKHVGVIGTGSSGIQVIPILAEGAAKVTVFQRTANFTLPAKNGPIDPALVERMREDYPAEHVAARRSLFGIPAERPTKSALEVSEEERTATFTERWNRGELIGVLSSYYDLLLDRAANETAGEFVRDRIREIVEDPALAEALVPQGYAFGTKRPCLDTNYYATYNRPNVRLVNLRETPLVGITEAGVQTEAEEHPLDVLVFATGFDAITGPLTAMGIHGRDGVPLTEAWKHGPVTYLGLSVPQFPNLFTVTGPGSPSVLSNMVVSIEQHVEWISDLILSMRERGVATIEATEVAAKDWTAHVQEVAEATLYPETDSWFTGANVPGKPKVFMPYVGGVGRYRRICDDVAAADYRGFVTR